MSGDDAADGIDAVYSAAGLLDTAAASSKRSNKRGEQTRDKLIRAAVECFTEYGYTKTRVSDITHHANTAQGNFYRHFTSLDDIFLAALKPSLEELAQSRLRPDRTHGELESLIEVNTTYLQTYARNRHMLRLLREAAAASENKGFSVLWLNLRAEFVRRTEHWLRRLDAEDRLESTDLVLLAETLGCATEQMAYVHVGLADSTPRRERIEELGRALGELWYRATPFRVRGESG
ncbi:TetR family transcriptional regulator [Gordonia amarae]|uniref:TetR family transcriptional regulator n=2 Tax=Gordonia amarae TaxID=36821 RepID=A0A857LN48_9ACTN|nr:TetR/AcrR family transcriptional regulator [Gordonia amarae]MCS3878219.1 AcrR family transcriptional regulator [Gordonia amarae]QHN16884.1 TetR family transcriptional regulator [Gordonia amarae]QHN21409.1 TetR family transcriptional regulator [Gordonia amarae]QHN30260.1 TetR family transcriptional regulator [Gordonia amarae]QHN39036.1 TetR family transcriptional regulator [Gordonia amarae]